MRRDRAYCRTIYAANCAACRGATGEGGIGPELHGENTRTRYRRCRLYPKPLGEKNVDDVAAFVEKL